jgi:AcrR family transcriptional regulator
MLIQSNMPRTPEQFQAMQEESRTAILQAALELFAENGFAQTSVAMIAKRAGISQGLMYNYFSGKDELLKAIFEQGWQDVQLSFIVQTPHKQTRPSLYDFIENALMLTLKHQGFWKLVHSLRGQPVIMANLKDDVERFERMIHQQLELFCRASFSPNPSAEAQLLFGLIDGIAIHLVREPDTYPLQEVLSLLKMQYQSRSI